MAIVAPSILSADFANLQRELDEMKALGIHWVHIDVMDGHFVPNITVGLPVVERLRRVTDLTLDVHLMITEPVRYARRFCQAGADLVTVHLEADTRENILEAIREIHAMGKKAGISVKPGTPAQALEPFLDQVELILVMTVEPGFGGQSYIDSCTDKVKAVRKLVKESGRDIDIQVDGGINMENLSVVLEAGANVIVAGSAVFKNDIAANVAEFLEKMK